MIEVILLERIEKLGVLGDSVRVRPGFARNFLLPQGKAVRANAENRIRFEKQRAEFEKQNQDDKAKAETLAEQLKDQSVILIRSASDSGQLYGSVRARDIAASLQAEQKTEIAHQQILLDRPMKSTGVFRQRLKLHPEIIIDIPVVIATSEHEAEQNLKEFRGEASEGGRNQSTEQQSTTGKTEDTVENVAEEAGSADTQETSPPAADAPEVGTVAAEAPAETADKKADAQNSGETAVSEAKDTKTEEKPGPEKTAEQSEQ